MFEGLYKVEFETPRRKSVGVIHAQNGLLRGGNSAFAYFGTFTQVGDTITGVVSSRRHTNDPNHPSVFGLDQVTIHCEGAAKGPFATFEGTAVEAPALKFKALLTRVSE